MRTIVGKLAAVLSYLLILCWLLKSEWTQVFSLKMAGLLILGTGILSLPWLSRGRTAQEWQNIIGKNALMTGYLQAFMFIFASLGESGMTREDLIMETGLNLRPVLYGYILYMILQKETQPGQTTKREEKEDLPEKKEPGEEETPIWENEKLTRREREIAMLIAKNLSNKEIAETLCISEATVKKHVSNIFEKLGVSSRKQLR